MTAERPAELDSWVAGASRGDARSVQSLVAHYLPQLRAFVRVRMDHAFRARETSSDIVQSTCRQLLHHGTGFEYRSEEQFKGWLFTAALNKIREEQVHHRRGKRDIAREAPPLGERGDGGLDGSGDEGLARSYASFATPSQAAIARERVAAVEQAFESLPDDYREVVALARIARLPHAEVAERMGKSVGAVRQMLARALNKLVVALGEEP